ncbi:MAG: tetratricopeptide repeat protein [Alphaproteobacteria bacterium]|nr:tetratricopeptide repeat protein [Alphaproteobacteria bacterium]
MSFTTNRLRPQFEEVRQLRAQGQAAVAEMLARQIVAAVPAGVDDLYCQASLLLEWNRPADALRRFDEARARGMVPPELLVDRAVALKRLGRANEAVASCDAALKLAPRFAPAHLIRAESLWALERHDEALADYDAALAAMPDFVHARSGRAALLMALSRPAEALDDLSRLLKQQPTDAQLHNRFGLALAELLRFDEALTAFDRAQALAPRDAGMWHNRGVALWSLERYSEAVESYDKALALNPGLFVTLSNRANTLQEMLRLDEAMAAHDRVVATWPDYVSGHWNRSQGRMLQGDWKEGLTEFEWRKRRPEVKADYLAERQWSGAEDLAGKTLLIRAEMALGDTIQFVRYGALAQDRGARVVLAVQPPLLRLVSESLTPPADMVIAKDDEPPPYDYQIASMSAPLAFGTTPDNAPHRVPYLKAEPALAARWKARLGDQGFKIGICWRGGRPGNDMGRTFPPALLAPLAALPGVRLISLQKGEGEAQLGALPAGMIVETLGEDFDAGPDAFRDTLAVMQSLDLVISCDTAIAHLAGAAARPLWMATKKVPEWRWLLHRTDSVWYPTARLFRQHEIGDWSNVFVEMENQLRKLLEDHA